MTAAVAAPETKALADVFKPYPYDDERIPHMAQCLGNLYGCLEQFAYHARYMRQSGENTDVLAWLDSIDPDAEALARKIAEKFAAAYPDLEPLLKEEINGKDFSPFTKVVALKEEKTMPEPVIPPEPKPPEKREEPPEKKEETKRLASYHKKAIEGAADHLDKLSSHDGLEDEHQKMCYHHAKALEGVLEDDEEGRGEKDDEEMTPEEKSLMQKVLAKQQREIEDNNKILQSQGK
jgi:hypothetical protein